MLAWDAAWLVDLAGVMWGSAEVGAMAPPVAVLTLEERLAVFHIVVVAVAPGAVEGVVVGMVGPGVVKVVAGVVDLIVGHVGKGRCAIDDTGGDAVIGIGVCKCLDAFEALFGDVFKVRSQGRNVIGDAASPFIEGPVAGDLGLQGVVFLLVHGPIYQTREWLVSIK
jgi:hypothetical protein